MSETDIKNHVQELIDASPAPQEHVIQQHMDAIKEKGNIREEFQGLVDREGLSFDPDLHILNNDGSPSITSTGKLRRKTRIAQAKIESKLLDNNQKSANAQPEQDTIKRKRTAAIITRLNEQLGIKLGGERHGKYIKKPEYDQDEEMEIFNAVDMYLLETGHFDIPPNITVALVLGMYWFRVSTTDIAKEKLGKMTMGKWLKSKFFRKKDNGAQLNSGDDRIGKDDTSQKDGKTSA